MVYKVGGVMVQGGWSDGVQSGSDGVLVYRVDDVTVYRVDGVTVYRVRMGCDSV